MKKVVSILLILSLVFTLSACGSTGKKIIGTWYNAENETIVFDKEGGFISSDWMGSGIIAVEDNKITLTSTRGSETLTFEDGKLIHYSGTEAKDVFYKTRAEAESESESIAVSQSESQAAAEAERIEKGRLEKDRVTKEIVGLWYDTFDSLIEFTADGYYIEYEDGKEKKYNYSITDQGGLEIQGKAGGYSSSGNYSQAISLTDKLEYNSYTYARATRIPLTKEALLGKWDTQSYTNEIEFTDSMLKTPDYFTGTNNFSYGITGNTSLSFNKDGKKGDSNAYVISCEENKYLLIQNVNSVSGLNAKHYKLNK